MPECLFFCIVWRFSPSLEKGDSTHSPLHQPPPPSPSLPEAFLGQSSPGKTINSSTPIASYRKKKTNPDKSLLSCGVWAEQESGAGRKRRRRRRRGRRRRRRSHKCHESCFLFAVMCVPSSPSSLPPLARCLVYFQLFAPGSFSLCLQKSIFCKSPGSFLFLKFVKSVSLHWAQTCLISRRAAGDWKTPLWYTHSCITLTRMVVGL